MVIYFDILNVDIVNRYDIFLPLASGSDVTEHCPYIYDLLPPPRIWMPDHDLRVET
jgi:hypothetical protein